MKMHFQDTIYILNVYAKFNVIKQICNQSNYFSTVGLYEVDNINM